MDKWLLVVLKFVRLLGYGLTTVILVPFLHDVGCSDAEIGLFMSLTLIGDVILSFLITFKADAVGRRFTLGMSSLLMLISGVCFMFSTNFWILLGAAVFGVISPSGDEVGPFRSIEESSVAQITHNANRAHIFAAQNLVGTFGMALGFVIGGWLTDFFTEKTGKSIDAYRVVFFGYVVCALVSFVISIQLTHEVEAPGVSLDEITSNNSTDNSLGSHNSGSGNSNDNVDNSSNDHSPLTSLTNAATSLSTSTSLIMLFGIDSLAYGFMNNSWLIDYLYRTFESSSTAVGSFFFIASSVSALTSFPSAWLTNRLGSLEAICITKLGAGLFGAIIPVAKHFWGAMLFILLRSLFDTMDVVPRQMFLTTVVEENDRTRVLGLVNIAKTIGRAIGPVFTGILAEHHYLSLCFPIMGCLEWVFSFVIYYIFR